MATTQHALPATFAPDETNRTPLTHFDEVFAPLDTSRTRALPLFSNLPALFTSLRFFILPSIDNVLVLDDALFNAAVDFDDLTNPLTTLTPDVTLPFKYLVPAVILP